MGLWHGVEHYEKMKITEKSDVDLFVKAWPKLLVSEKQRLKVSSIYIFLDKKTNVIVIFIFID